MDPEQPLTNAYNDFWMRMFGNPKCCVDEEGKAKTLARLDAEIAWERNHSNFTATRCGTAAGRLLTVKSHVAICGVTAGILLTVTSHVNYE